jgi:hypothetical protein
VTRVTQAGDYKCVKSVSSENLKGSDCFENLSLLLHWRTIRKRPSQPRDIGFADLGSYFLAQYML